MIDQLIADRNFSFIQTHATGHVLLQGLRNSRTIVYTPAGNFCAMFPNRACALAYCDDSETVAAEAITAAISMFASSGEGPAPVTPRVQEIRSIFR